jgi:hypothetical protein
MTRSTHYPRYQRFLDLLREARQAAGVRRIDVVDLVEYCEAAGIDVVRFFERLKQALDASPRPRLGKLAIREGRSTKASAGVRKRR